MVKKYVKKPIPIEAIQYDGSNFEELAQFAGPDIYKKDDWIYIHTLEGEMKMKNPIGDYLIKGPIGEFYFCEKSVFELTYQQISSSV